MGPYERATAGAFDGQHERLAKKRAQSICPAQAPGVDSQEIKWPAAPKPWTSGGTCLSRVTPG